MRYLGDFIPAHQLTDDPETLASWSLSGPDATWTDGVMGATANEPSYDLVVQNGVFETGGPDCSEIAQCGNGLVEGEEVCDDGNTFEGDDCSASCESISSTVLKSAAGHSVTCHLHQTGAIQCWGDVDTPANLITTPDGVFTDVSCGADTCCAADETTQIVCWGSDDQGQIAGIPEPSNATTVSVGYGHVCAIEPSGALHCWGQNDFHQILPSSQATLVAYLATAAELRWLLASSCMHRASPIGRSQVSARAMCSTGAASHVQHARPIGCRRHQSHPRSVPRRSRIIPRSG